MITPYKLFLFIILYGIARSAPVENPTGMVLRQHTVVRLPVVSQVRVTHYLLRPGGTCVGLYSTLEARDSSGPISTVSIPPDGTWSFRKTSDTSMELTLSPIGRQLLEFRSDSSGVVVSAVGIETTFDFVPYENGTPLTNCSNRSNVNERGTAFTGFVIASPSRGRVLVRAIGPGLQQFGITDSLRSPVLSVLDAATNRVIATNSGWLSSSGVAAAGARVGAFDLAGGSRDSALFLSLSPGTYIAEVRPAESTDSGQVLIEVYMCP